MVPKYKTFFYYSFGQDISQQRRKVHLHFHELKALKTQDQIIFISVITLQILNPHKIYTAYNTPIWSKQNFKMCL
jgi:hypothetical protein